jgi:hypothetical protein
MQLLFGGLRLSFPVSSLLVAVGMSCSSVNAEQINMRGQLVDADTRQPIANAIISATSKTRQLLRVDTMTAPDGSFVLPVESGLPYAVCSRSVGRYISTCTFSKPVTAIANSEAKPVLIAAPAGIRVRVKIQDPARRIPVSRVPASTTDPLDLLVYAEDSITSTRVPFPVTKVDANGFEVVVVMPATRSWRLAMSSVRHALIDAAGRRYMPDSAILASRSEAGGEHVVVFSVAAGK